MLFFPKARLSSTHPDIRWCIFLLIWALSYSNDHRKIIRHIVDIKSSFLGFLVYLAVFIAWLSIYLTKRNDMGAVGDDIAVVIPNGR